MKLQGGGRRLASQRVWLPCKGRAAILAPQNAVSRQLPNSRPGRDRQHRPAPWTERRRSLGNVGATRAWFPRCHCSTN